MRVNLENVKVVKEIETEKAAKKEDLVDKPAEEENES